MLKFNEWKKTPGFPVRPSMAERMDFVQKLKDAPKEDKEVLALLAYDFYNIWGRDEQVPYYFNNDWTTCALISGRGFGKTLTGAQWCRYLLFQRYPNNAIRIGIVCPTNSDAEKVILRGDSGILAVLSPHEMAQCKYNINQNKLTFKNGSTVYVFSAEEADRLRGSQFHFVWADEMAAWRDLDECLMQINFCLRLKPPDGMPSQRLYTTTPKPEEWLRDLWKRAQANHRILFISGSTYDNAANLDAAFYDEIIKYEGTDIGRQEIYGEILLENNNSIIKKQWIRYWSADKYLPKFKLVFGSYDTAFTAKMENDPSAGLILGIFEDRDGEDSVIILDAWSEHLEYPDLRAQILNDWEYQYGDEDYEKELSTNIREIIKNRRYPDCMIVENKASGQIIVRDICNLGVKIIRYTPGRGDDKQARMNAVSYLFKDGRVYFLESKKNRGRIHPHFEALVDELINFPLVKHDDYCDAMSQALIVFLKGGLVRGDRTTREDDEEMGHYNMPRENPYMSI